MPKCRHLGSYKYNADGYSVVELYTGTYLQEILKKIFGKKIHKIPIDILESPETIVDIMKLQYNGGKQGLDQKKLENFNKLTASDVIRYMIQKKS